MVFLVMVGPVFAFAIMGAVVVYAFKALPGDFRRSLERKAQRRRMRDKTRLVQEDISKIPPVQLPCMDWPVYAEKIRHDFCMNQKEARSIVLSELRSRGIRYI